MLTATRGEQIGQLFKIFEILGTPSENTWQGVEGMPCWQAQFPQWHAQDLAEVGTPGHVCLTYYRGEVSGIKQGY